MIPQLAAGMGGMMAQQPLMEQPKPRAGMFGAGSGKPDWAGAISAALNGFLAARGNPVGMMGLQQMQMARQQALSEQQRQQHRGEDFEDWVKKQAWAQAHKPADVPDIAERVSYLNTLEPNLGNTYARNYAQSGGSIFGRMFTDPATGQQFMLGGQAGGAPQIGSVIDDPRQGGPTPSASGGFPGPY